MTIIIDTIITGITITIITTTIINMIGTTVTIDTTITSTNTGSANVWITNFTRNTCWNYFAEVCRRRRQ